MKQVCIFEMTSCILIYDPGFLGVIKLRKLRKYRQGTKTKICCQANMRGLQCCKFIKMITDFTDIGSMP